MTTPTGNELEALATEYVDHSERGVPVVLVVVRSADEPAEVRRVSGADYARRP
jgi:hypothetical protein